MNGILSGLMLALIPLGALAVSLLILFALVYRWRAKDSRSLRASPLTDELLRSPGHSLRKKIDDIDDDLNASMAILFVTPIAALALHVSDSHFRGTPESILRYLLSIAVVLIATFYFGRRITKNLDQRRRYILGMEGELATGQELDQLMLHGCHVYHDIKAKHGNIDHVVVSRSGVYCVETKTISKFQSEAAKAEVIVDHNQNLLCFDSFQREIPVKQIDSQVSWLSKYLSSSTGDPVRVEGILALPGYFVKDRIGKERVNKGSHFVLNPVKPRAFFVRSRQVLSDQMVTRIAHQLERLCRDVQPSFQQESEWQEETA